LLYILILFRGKDELQCELGTIYPEDACFGSRDEGRNSLGIRNYQCCWNSNFMEQTIYIFQVTIWQFCLLVVLAKRTHIVFEDWGFETQVWDKIGGITRTRDDKKRKLTLNKLLQSKKASRKSLKRILTGDRK